SMITDALDGIDARKGAALLGTETTPAGAISDPAADKKLTNGLLLGLTGRFIRQRDYLSASVVVSNYVITQLRDKRMARNRQLISDYGLNPDELKAKKINKIKMA